MVLGSANMLMLSLLGSRWSLGVSGLLCHAFVDFMVRIGGTETGTGTAAAAAAATATPTLRVRSGEFCWLALAIPAPWPRMAALVGLRAGDPGPGGELVLIDDFRIKSDRKVLFSLRMGSLIMLPNEETELDRRLLLRFSLAVCRRLRAKYISKATAKAIPPRIPHITPTITPVVGKLLLFVPCSCPWAGGEGIGATSVIVGTTTGGMTGEDVALGTVDDTWTVAGGFVWSGSIIHCSRSLQVYPKGQQAVPHCGNFPFNAVVLMEAPGSASTFCSATSHVIGLILVQSFCGQHRPVVLPARAIHVWPLAQQKLLGKPAGHDTLPEAAQVVWRSNTDGMVMADVVVTTDVSISARKSSGHLDIANVVR
jgi:hypothetical protein